MKQSQRFSKRHFCSEFTHKPKNFYGLSFAIIFFLLFLYVVPYEISSELEVAEIISSSNRPSQNIIPKLVHIIWLKGIGVPYDLRHAEIEEGTQSLFQLQLNVTQDLNPNYELRVYDDVKALAILEDFDMELAKIYEKEPLACYRSDILRVVILYLYGGVYLDTDVEVFEPLDRLFKDMDYPEAIASVSVYNDNWFILQAILAFVPEHPLLLTVIREIKHIYDQKEFHLYWRDYREQPNSVMGPCSWKYAIENHFNEKIADAVAKKRIGFLYESKLSFSLHHIWHYGIMDNYAVHRVEDNSILYFYSKLDRGTRCWFLNSRRHFGFSLRWKCLKDELQGVSKYVILWFVFRISCISVLVIWFLLWLLRQKCSRINHDRRNLREDTVSSVRLFYAKLPKKAKS